MYPAALAKGLGAVGVEATTVAALRLTGSSDAEVFAVANAAGHAVLTENVGDFTRIAAEQSIAGGHHHGLLIALSSRFSRRPAGAGPLISAIDAIAQQRLADRVVYLERPRDPWARPGAAPARSRTAGRASVLSEGGRLNLCNSYHGCG